jgi:hypothetical protein
MIPPAVMTQSSTLITYSAHSLSLMLRISPPRGKNGHTHHTTTDTRAPPPRHDDPAPPPPPRLKLDARRGMTMIA